MIHSPQLNDLRDEAIAAWQKARQPILDRWRDAVGGVLPDPQDQARCLLSERLPHFLDEIAAALEQKPFMESMAAPASSPMHDPSLAHLLAGYQLLRRIAIEEMAKALGKPLPSEQSVILNQQIDRKISSAAIEHAARQAEALQAEAAAMTRFLSFVSHDLRGGINGVVLMIEVLKRELKAGEKATVLEDLETIRRSMFSTVQTLERYLTAEKFRHGQIAVRIDNVAVRELLQELESLLSAELAEHGVQLRLQVDPPDLNIRSDRQLLSLILQNLASNAIRYGRRQNVIIKADGAARGSTGFFCQFTVTDRGVGIAPEKLAQLLAPLSPGQTYGQKGMGAGLFIARHAAELLGARLWAESKLGEGSTFGLDLI